MILDIAVPTKQRLAHANDNFVVDPKTRAHHFRDTPIERLAARGAITPAQLEAGKRYAADHYAAGLAPLGAVDYARPVVDGSPPKTESDYRLGALQRWNAAKEALGDLGKVVDPVVLHEVSVEAAGRAIGWANRPQAVAAATELLKAGLGILARRYGLA